MARPSFATTISSLLVCTLIIAPVVSFAEGDIPHSDSDAVPDPKVAAIRHKLEQIIIPKLEFREATVREAIDFLVKKSADLDPAGQRGLSIVLRLDEPGGKVAGPAAAPGAQISPIPGTPTSGTSSVPTIPETRITVSLTNIPLIEALKYVTGLANLKFKIEPGGISIVPASTATDVLITKEWKIPPDLIPRTPAEAGATQGISAPGTVGGASGVEVADATKGGSKVADRLTAKNWLIASGVVFNGAASAIYIPKSSRLIVRNTQDQLDLVDTIISSSVPGVAPVRVEIECKFVEVQQNNLKESGFDSALGQLNLQFGQNVFRSGPNIGTSPAIPADQLPFQVPKEPSTTGTVSGGNRSISPKIIEELFFPTPGASSKPPLTSALCGVFTDPQFQLVMRALNQRKGVDILSAPKLTLRSGQCTVIEAIREFRNVAEDPPPQIPRTIDARAVAKHPDAGGGNSADVPSAARPSSPVSYEDRNLGVTIEVSPVVGPDGYTIDLNITPQFVEFEGFTGYGSPITRRLTNPQAGVSQQNIITPQANIQPIFSNRKVTTSVSVFDGSTVAISGWEDEVTLFGDVPMTDSHGHPKRHFLIFVSARLVNAASEPVRAADEKEEVIEKIAPPEVPPSQLPLMPR